MKMLLVVGLVAVGCGADPGVSDGGVEALCRPPTGCVAVIIPATGRCDYDCRSVGAYGVACFPLPDGGVASHGEFMGGVPPAVAALPTRYAADLSRNLQNCGRCGVRCGVGEVCGLEPFSRVVMCYRP